MQSLQKTPKDQEQKEVNVSIVLIAIVPKWYEKRLHALFPLDTERGDYHYKSVPMGPATSVQFYINHWSYDLEQVRALQRVGSEMRTSGYADMYAVTFTLMPKFERKQ